MLNYRNPHVDMGEEMWEDQAAVVKYEKYCHLCMTKTEAYHRTTLKIMGILNSNAQKI